MFYVVMQRPSEECPVPIYMENVEVYVVGDEQRILTVWGTNLDAALRFASWKQTVAFMWICELGRDSLSAWITALPTEESTDHVATTD